MKRATIRKVICECGDDTYDKAIDDNGNPIWVCNNCRKTTKRQTRTGHRGNKLRKEVENERAIWDEVRSIIRRP